MDTEHSEIRSLAFYEDLLKKHKRYKFIYIQAPFGWGKVAIAEYLFDYGNITNVVWVEWQEDFVVSECFINIEIQEAKVVVFSGFEQAVDRKELYEFVEYIRKNKIEYKVIILSTIPVPGVMLPLTVSGNFYALGVKDIAPTARDIKRYLNVEGVQVSEYELQKIQQDFHNMPLGISFVVSRMRESVNGYDRYVKMKCRDDMHNYIDLVLLRRIPVVYQTYLMKLAYFQDITEQLIENILGISTNESREFLIYIRRMGSIVQESDITGQYRFYPMMKVFLKACVTNHLTNTEMSKVYEAAISFYLEQEIYEQALFFSDILGKEELVIYIIETMVKRTGNNVDYIILESYLDNISLYNLRARPKLMVAKAMVEAISGNVDEAWRWYEIIEKMVQNIDEYSNQEEILACHTYLFVAMPGKNVKGLLENLIVLENKIIQEERWVEQFPIVVTSNLPTLIHGVKDFIQYGITYGNILKKLEPAVEIVLGKHQLSSLMFGEGELLYEFNQVDQALEILQKGMKHARRYKNDALYFAGAAIIYKALVVKNNWKGIHSLMHIMEETLEQVKAPLLNQNLQTFLVEMELLKGKTQKIESWMKYLAPEDNSYFSLYRIYQYVIKIKVHILLEEYMKAFILINKIINHTKNYELSYLQIQMLIYKAIILFRQGNPNYRSELHMALSLGEELGIIRIFADEGVALLPLLLEYKKEHQENKGLYLKEIIKATKKQRELYPKYLVNPNVADILTTTEKEVLDYLIKGMKNAEIADSMFVSENTIKYHLKNIYSKLEVTSRSQAIKVATEKGV